MALRQGTHLPSKQRKERVPTSLALRTLVVSRSGAQLDLLPSTSRVPQSLSPLESQHGQPRARTGSSPQKLGDAGHDRPGPRLKHVSCGQQTFVQCPGVAGARRYMCEYQRGNIPDLSSETGSLEALRFQGVDLGGASYIAALPGHTLDTVPEGPKLPHPVPPAPHLS